MKLREMGSYLFVPERSDRPGQHLRELKRLEWIFIGARWVWVPVIFLMNWLHLPHSPPRSSLMVAMGITLAACNIIACLLNVTIKTPRAQRALGFAMLAVDTLLAWGIILVFVRDFYTAAYAVFMYVILQAALRYGFGGSLAMALVFILGLYGAFLYREAAFEVRFSYSGYAFWTVLMTVVAVAVGIIVNEGRRQRRQSEIYLRENTLLAERHRIARDLHDTVLKTLQGLSLEARALGNRADSPSAVKDTAKYIEDVCSRTGREIREVIFALRSDAAAAGIGRQLSGMLDAWSKDTGIPTDFTLSGPDVALPAETARQLGNIVSEALLNVQRHAAASRVGIDVQISSGEMTVEIRDNGRGIGRGMDDLPALVAAGRLGIAGMKERAELLGGRFSLGGDGGGTAVRLFLPVGRPPEGL